MLDPVRREAFILDVEVDPRVRGERPQPVTVLIVRTIVVVGECPLDPDINRSRSEAHLHAR